VWSASNSGRQWHSRWSLRHHYAGSALSNDTVQHRLLGLTNQNMNCRVIMYKSIIDVTHNNNNNNTNNNNNNNNSYRCQALKVNPLSYPYLPAYRAGNNITTGNCQSRKISRYSELCVHKPRFTFTIA